jgi:ubiquinone/menaquinone biosynthesis C-methylase UbiE
MDLTVLLVSLGMVAAVLALGYWTIVITEGAYLGRWLVSYLYNRGADTYDEVKEFDSTEDAWFLGVPMARDLEGVSQPLVLDVAAGTGRVALSLLRQLNFDGHVVGMDYAREMLHVARRKTQRYPDRITLIWRDATALPFADESFDAVACVEALEFLPAPRVTLAEMVRVLRPGGSFLVTNRIGWERYLMPGRAFKPAKLEAILTELGLTRVWTKPWQTYYDLIWARKPGEMEDRGSLPALVDVLRCPVCGSPMRSEEASGVFCDQTRHRFAWDQDILKLEETV